MFWHKNDAHGWPTLIICLGLAYTTLTPSERPLFAQAIVSQVIKPSTKEKIHMEGDTMGVVANKG